MSERARAWLLSATLLLAAAPAAAEQSKEAAAHFSRGLEHAKQGDLESAASAFEAAYRLSPHPAVLYNLGQTYASLGRPVEAVRALKQYLAEAEGVTSARRAEVGELIAFHERRIGKLAVSLQPADAELLLDGHPVERALLTAPIEIAAGTHVLEARKEGHLPATLTRVVRPQQTVEARLELHQPQTDRRAWLDVSCPIVDATVYVDGTVAGRTPLRDPIPVNAGQHEIAFTRAGYEGAPSRVQVDSRAAVACNLKVSTRLTERDSSRLRVAGAPVPARVLVDDQQHSGQLLPPGRHTVRIESGGYRSFSDEVTLTAGRTTVLDVELSPTPEQRRRLEEDEKSTRRTYAYVGASLGAALCATAGALYAVNTQRYNEYSADSKTLSRDLASGPVTPGQLERASDLNDEADAIQTMDYVALATGIVGVAVLGGSVALYLSAQPDSTKLETGSGMINFKGVMW